ncbi:polyprenyl synthetase [Streptomyces sp. NPDC020875]|uniref:polyprenyl synthetase n=1 Tax=Streptomyces sp. NPDC020875 TaxID=3154898 RepID=UPI0033F92352
MSMSSSPDADRDRRLDEQAVLVAAGLADLALSTAGTVVGTAVDTVRGLLRRSDTADLLEDAGHDLRARGRIAIDRYASRPPAHLEVLARHSRAAAVADAPASDGG